MKNFSLSDFNFLVFIIPGFITVWTYRYCVKSKKKGDFELLGLSFFWGLTMLIIFEILWPILTRFFHKDSTVEELLQNPYAAAFVLSMFGWSFGWIGGSISKLPIFKKIIKIYMLKGYSAKPKPKSRD